MKHGIWNMQYGILTGSLGERRPEETRCEETSQHAIQENDSEKTQKKRERAMKKRIGEKVSN